MTMQIMQQKWLKKRQSKSLLAGSLIAAFIAASPYFFYLYEGFPAVKVWETSFFGIDFKYESSYYENVNVVGWILFGKFIPLSFLIIWFFTCKHWWYHSILVPIIMYVFQIYGTLEDDLTFMDSKEIFYLAPIVLFSLIFLYTIRMKIFDRIHNIDLTELERVSLKGDIKDEDGLSNQYEDDDEDDEPLFMG
tara:strand:- start:2231 stop:2806 length:576 start_codon:yes stop_codon:yes gene_type:complete